MSNDPSLQVRGSATVVWACALFLSSMPLMFWGKYAYSGYSYNCGLDPGEGIHRSVLFVYIRWILNHTAS